MGQTLRRVLEEFPSEEPGGTQSSLGHLRVQSPPLSTPERAALSRIGEAYAKGFEEGQAAARAEAVSELAAAHEEFRSRLEEASALFSLRLADELSGKLQARLADLQAAIADQVATALVPVVRHALTEASIREIVEGLRVLAAADGALTVELRGPKALVDKVWARYCQQQPEAAALAPDVTFATDESADLCVNVNDAVIESRLMDWFARLVEAVR